MGNTNNRLSPNNTVLQNDISMELKIFSGFFILLCFVFGRLMTSNTHTIINEIQQQSKHTWKICWWYQKIFIHKYIDSEIMKNNKFESYAIDVSASNDKVCTRIWMCSNVKQGRGPTKLFQLYVFYWILFLIHEDFLAPNWPFKNLSRFFHFSRKLNLILEGVPLRFILWRNWHISKNPEIYEVTVGANFTPNIRQLIRDSL